MKSWFLGFACLLIAAAICGCGSGHPNVVPVSGAVTYQGQPVSGAQVNFMAPGAARAAYGVTDAEGKFRLSTFGTDDGALIGSHIVTVAKPTETVTGAGMSADDPDGGYAAAMAQAAKSPAVKSELPDKYANAQTSGLTAEVTQAGPNEFTFPLE
jgi:hypothetical protein